MENEELINRSKAWMCADVVNERIEAMGFEVIRAPPAER